MTTGAVLVVVVLGPMMDVVPLITLGRAEKEISQVSLAPLRHY